MYALLNIYIIIYKQMKKLYYLIFALFVANVTVYATPQNIWDENSWDDPNEYQEDDEIEIQSNIFSPCISGGPGSTSCSLDGDADGFGGKCSVTCTGLTYACCGVGCHCVDISHIHEHQ